MLKVCFGPNDLPAVRHSYTLNSADSALRHKESRSGKNQKYLAFNKIQERIEFLQKNQTRNWKAGDVYSPRDLGSTEMKKWRKRQSPTMDAFDAMGVNPLHLYKVRSSLFIIVSINKCRYRTFL